MGATENTPPTSPPRLRPLILDIVAPDLTPRIVIKCGCCAAVLMSVPPGNMDLADIEAALTDHYMSALSTG